MQQEKQAQLDQFNEVLSYLNSKQVEARHTALDIILAYTA